VEPVFDWKGVAVEQPHEALHPRMGNGSVLLISGFVDVDIVFKRSFIFFDVEVVLPEELRSV
jgi:hypothetical protein